MMSDTLEARGLCQALSVPGALRESRLLFLKLLHTSDSPGGLLSTQSVSPHPEFLIREVLGRFQELTFLTCSHVLLVMPAQGPR